MDWQEALLVRLRANAGVQSVLGVDGKGSRKAYWSSAPQGTTFPYLVLRDRTAGRPQTLRGWDLEASRVQIDVHSTVYAETVAVMNAAVAALVSGHTSNGHTFYQADVDLGPWDAPEVQVGAVTVLTKQADLIIHHKPA